MKLSKTSIMLLVIQLAIVGSIAAKYLYERSVCPRVWTRTAMYDPELVMRGRYLSMRLEVDGCQIPAPLTNEGDSEGGLQGGRFGANAPQWVEFPAKLSVENNKLIATREDGGQIVFAQNGRPCESMRLTEPVNFYIAEHAASPTPVRRGQELWVEVTVPPKGPPRPIQLALKDNGVWKPLAFQ